MKGYDMENKTLIDNAIGFIQKNPGENLSLQGIADNAGFSLTYFDAMFQRHTGYSPVEYSRVYKLTRSALALRRTEKSILDIALEFGYASPESFARAFKNFYGMSPSEYRKTYSAEPITWHDLSGKIAISHFRRNFPELKSADVSLALDYCFTHNPLKYAEDMINMTIAETEVLTLGDPVQLSHFVYVSDYNNPEPAVTIVCEEETDAIAYLNLLSKNQNLRFSMRKSVDCEWDAFDAEVAQLGLTCRYGYDMVYPREEVLVPEPDGMIVRELTTEDMTILKAFRQSGGCADCHVKAIQIHFDGKGNVGMRPVGLFADGEMVALALPTMDRIRDRKWYDIGGIFTTEKGKNDPAIELIWKYVIAMCLQENAVLGNANALEDDMNPWEKNSPLSVEFSERMGLVKVGKNCGYRK